MQALANAFHGRPRLPWFTLGLAALTATLYAVAGGAPSGLVYDRAAIESGEVWRLATGHLVHLDLHHLGYNLGALLALGTAYELAPFGGPRRLALHIFGVGGLAVTATLLAFFPDTLRYCGLSALLNTLYAALTLGLWKETREKIWLFALAANVAKIAWEAAFGPIFSAGLAWPPHLGAHVAGLLAGCLVALAGQRTIPDQHPESLSQPARASA
ncbi:rhombosortase [Afifella marina]|uniref:Rhomboid family GlyGly-CTERM serine protease n=1 Tax=Afifella marina DSM 2698 TaxID=1120955 RepID=A0A1G5N5E9_AFIMA|nr:rhombosortase [Afifella marina]MBK1622439.1 rhombosortase [Afifella marina DSM 2698]MBK1626847.1 rhombosortase [Afifella marina]MBK5919223.1 rhombosortase [Afifella marina]RAI21265.1 rhombosortase [Afifella marina DSM 2698]SCZ32128.1 rhomboid family GlyGly-CTERM serine protease [Afifella marina DSM 2698]